MRVDFWKSNFNQIYKKTIYIYNVKYIKYEITSSDDTNVGILEVNVFSIKLVKFYEVTTCIMKRRGSVQYYAQGDTDRQR